MKYRIYIAGPMSQGDKIENLTQAMKAFRKLAKKGFAPLCPQLTFFAEPFLPLDHKGWLSIDLPWVSVAHAVLRLPGKSVGADMEVAQAQKQALPIYTSIKKLCEDFLR